MDNLPAEMIFQCKTFTSKRRLMIFIDWVRYSHRLSSCERTESKTGERVEWKGWGLKGRIGETPVDKVSKTPFRPIVINLFRRASP